MRQQCKSHSAGKKKKITHFPVCCNVEMGLSLWNVWASRMQMNQLIEKSMPEPRLCLFSFSVWMDYRENWMANKTVCCKKVITILSAYLQHGVPEKASNLYVLHFNGITSILKQFQKSHLHPSQQNKQNIWSLSPSSLWKPVWQRRPRTGVSSYSEASLWWKYFK